VRTVKAFVERMLISLEFGLDSKESTYQAIRSVLVQFTDESSVFIQRKNIEILDELEPVIGKVVSDFGIGKKK
jgi:hypothetical protein